MIDDEIIKSNCLEESVIPKRAEALTDPCKFQLFPPTNMLAVTLQHFFVRVHCVDCGWVGSGLATQSVSNALLIPSSVVLGLERWVKIPKIPEL